tara:strand:+ start:1422 stop:2279 length:858 start_codon:yes stop_codon:yes gene_type:complete
MNLEIDKNKIKNGLYIVATPIGNLKDITYRALEILKNSDYILCEDTRISSKLLAHFNIKSKLISNHKFNEKKNLKKIIYLLNSYKVLSLISDAGTPTISDPGKILIEECIKNNISVFPVPGPSSVSASISISGFSDKYYFHGFLPEKKSAINKDFEKLSKLNCSIIFFISARKINKIIYLMKKYFKKRNIVICREITKYYEEYFRSSVESLEEFKNILKGEITIVISDKNEDQNNLNLLTESDKKKIKKLITKSSIKDIINAINEKKNVSKKEIYNYCLSLKNEK